MAARSPIARQHLDDYCGLSGSEENGVPVPGGGDTSGARIDGSHRLWPVKRREWKQNRLVYVIVGYPRRISFGISWARTASPPTTGQPRRPQHPPDYTATDPPAPPRPQRSPRRCRCADPGAILCPAGSTASTGGFHVAGGQIIGPDGKAWIARGIDLHAANLGAAAQLLPTQFPGVNLVRVAAGDGGRLKIRHHLPAPSPR